MANIDALTGRNPLAVLLRPFADIRKHADGLRESADRQLRNALNRFSNRDPYFLGEMAAHLATLPRPPRNTSADAARDAYYRALRDDTLAAVQGRTVRPGTISSQLLQWIGDRRLADEQRIELGRKLKIIAAASRLLRLASGYLDEISQHYRQFRSVRQTEGQWYRAGNHDPANIHPIEVDLLLCAMFFAAKALERLQSSNPDAAHLTTSTLGGYRGLFRNQVLVDEATDFSPLQLHCMSAVAHPATNSFFACGDFDQRITP